MEAREKCVNIVYKIIISVFSIVMAVILVTDIVLDGWDHMLKQENIIPDIAALVIGLLLAVMLYFYLRAAKEDISFNIYIAALVVFCLQIFIFYNILFVTETWDVAVVLKSAREIISGRLPVTDADYYSYFPNNQMILFIVVTLLRVANVFGWANTPAGLMLIVAVQSLLSSITGVLIYLIARDLIHSTRWAVIVWFVYTVLVALSAWNIVPYTDMMALIFPTLVFRIYQSFRNNRVKWFLIFALSYLGFKIKPTAIIALIAIVCIESVGLIGSFRKDAVKNYLISFASALVGLAVAAALCKASIMSLPVEIDPQKNTGAAHMLMMGVNPETNGSINFHDVALSRGITDPDARKAAQVDTIKSRLSSMGARGIPIFFLKKAAMIFNDGTFSMGIEGGFYDVVYDDKIPFVSSLLKNIYYNYGKYFIASSAVCQVLWMIIILASVSAAAGKFDKYETVIALSLLGIIIFNLLFEARARYLFIYAPFFILMGAICLKNVYGRIKKNG